MLFYSRDTYCILYCDKSEVLLSRPLYFQHDGHSRTIVGIQVKRQRNGMQQYNLLILDPSHVSIMLYPFAYTIQSKFSSFLYHSCISNITY